MGESREKGKDEEEAAFGKEARGSDLPWDLYWLWSCHQTPPQLQMAWDSFTLALLAKQ